MSIILIIIGIYGVINIFINLYKIKDDLTYKKYTDDIICTVLNKDWYTYPEKNIDNTIKYKDSYNVYIYDNDYNSQIRIVINKSQYKEISVNSKIEVRRNIYKNKDNNVKGFTYTLENILKD